MQISISNPNLNKLKICKYPHISARKGLKRAVCTIRWTGSGGRVWRGGGKGGRVHNRATRAVFSVETPSAWNAASTGTPSRFHRQTVWPLGQSEAPPATLASNMALRAASALPARLLVRDSRFTSHRRFTFSCSINSRILLYPREFMVREWNNLLVIDDRGKLIGWNFSLDVNFVILFFFLSKFGRT